MMEHETPRVQRLAFELDRPERLRSEDIALLADERVPAQPRLKTNLIPLPRLETNLDERSTGERLDRSVPADGLRSPWIGGMRFLLNERLVVPHETVPPGAGG